MQIAYSILQTLHFINSNINFKKKAPCEPNPCQNGGVCENTLIGTNYFQCDCVHGYSGIVCLTRERNF